MNHKMKENGRNKKWGKKLYILYIGVNLKPNCKCIETVQNEEKCK